MKYIMMFTVAFVPAYVMGDSGEMFLQVWEQREVPAPELGLLTDVRVDKGQLVVKGEILAKMDDREQVIARDRAILELDVAKKRIDSAAAKIELNRYLLQFATNALHRAETSNDEARDSVSEAELEQLMANRQQAEFDLRESEHQLQVLRSMADLKMQDLRAAEVALTKRTIISPISGEVADVHVRNGEWIEPGTVLVRILQADQLVVETLVPSSADIDGLLNRVISLIVDMPNHDSDRFEGRVDYVSSEVGAVDGRVRIRIRISNADNRLRPGFQVRIVTPGINDE